MSPTNRRRLADYFSTRPDCLPTSRRSFILIACSALSRGITEEATAFACLVRSGGQQSDAAPQVAEMYRCRKLSVCTLLVDKTPLFVDESPAHRRLLVGGLSLESRLAWKSVG